MSHKSSPSIKKQFIDNQVSAFSDNDTDGLGMINKHRIVLDMIREHAQPDSTILDIGCSDGKILFQLEEEGYHNLYGLDIQERSKQSFVGSKIQYQACDVEREPIPFDNKFDIIVLSDVLEHLFSPQTLLYDLKPLLSPKGKIIFSFPNAGWFLNGILLTFFPSKLFVSPAFGPWGHTYQFTFHQARKIANILHYKVVELKGGRLDNYAFRTGLKKIVFDLFALFSIPFITFSPIVFSAHIFGVFENTRAKPKSSSRFDSGL